MKFTVEVHELGPSLENPKGAHRINCTLENEKEKWGLAQDFNLKLHYANLGKEERLLLFKRVARAGLDACIGTRRKRIREAEELLDGMDELNTLVHNRAMRRAYVQVLWARRQRLYTIRELGEIMGLSVERTRQELNRAERVIRYRRMVPNLFRAGMREHRFLTLAALIRHELEERRRA